MDITRIIGVFTIVIILYSVQVTAQFMGDTEEAMQCVTRLLPCEPYIHLSIPPPPSCCTPMKEIAEKEVKCLCAAFNHPEVLRFIALTKETALNLLTSCGVNHNLSLCNTSSSTKLSEAASSENSGSTKKSAALVFSFVSAFLGMVFF